MPQDPILTVDAGTQSCRTILWSAGGQPLAETSLPLRIAEPAPDRREQDAEEWWTALAGSLRRLMRGRRSDGIACLALTWQRETFVMTDPKGRPVGPALLWMDRRAAGELEIVRREIGEDAFHRRTGKQLDLTSTLPRLLWLRRHLPSSMKPETRFQDVGGFLTHRLCGRCATCTAGADTTGLIDLHTGAWIEPFLERAGLTADRLPDLLPPGGRAGEVTPEAARATGLPQGLPVIVAGGDGHVFSEGVGGGAAEAITLNLGTSIVVGRRLETPVVSPSFRTLIGTRPGAFQAESVIHSGTRVLIWCIDRMRKAEGRPSAAHFDRRAAGIPAGSEGLVTVPYWNGVRVPYNDPLARGITVGWTETHTPDHLYRSLLEGIAFEVRLLAEHLQDAASVRADRLCAGGGGARSPLWRSILAGVSSLPVFAPHHVESTSRGAAMIGAAAVGIHPSIEEAADRMAARAERTDPGPEQPLYEEIYTRVYRRLYPALREALADLAEIVRPSPPPGEQA